MPTSAPNRRILVIDDNEAIHADYQKILVRREDAGRLGSLEAELFGEAPAPSAAPASFSLDSAFQGDAGVRMAEAALARGEPYAVAFVDIRMPPGIDGVATTELLWKLDPHLQVVICSAYSDYTWEEIHRRLGGSERLLILRKPFDAIEVRQLAHALTEKWDLLRLQANRQQELERLVKERTAELEAAYSRLAETQKLEALGLLAAGLAHEVNNPLSFVQSNLQYLGEWMQDAARQDEVAPDAREALADGLAGAKRIAEIVRDFRLFAQTGPAGREVYSLREVLEHAVRVTAPMVGRRAEVSLQAEADPLVLASGPELSQAFVNLLMNAGQALPAVRAPGSAVRLRVARERDQVVVEVKDNGSGIPRELLPRVFEPFFSTRRPGSATGMGLSVCHGIVRRMGGRMEIESEEGRGTTVRVYLPEAPRNARPAALNAA